MLSPPMLFPRNPAHGGISGPQAWLGAEKGLFKVGKVLTSSGGAIGMRFRGKGWGGQGKEKKQSTQKGH
jgi:hypothetical protein